MLFVLQARFRFSRDIVIWRGIIRHLFGSGQCHIGVASHGNNSSLVTMIWTLLAGRGLRSGVAVRGFVSGMGPAAVAVGRIAPTGRTAPTAPAGIACPKFLWFQKWFLKAQEFKNHHKNLRIIKIFWNHPPVSGHFATFSGFARKFYIVLQPWLTHGQPVNDRRSQCK